MKVILPGAAIGLLGGSESSRMLALAAQRIGYRVHILPEAQSHDLDRVREFAAGVDVVTVATNDVPAITLQAAASSGLLRPSVKTFEAVGDGIAARREESPPAVLEFSIVVARGVTGECLFYDPIAIDRVDGVLDIARWPAPLGLRVAARAREMARDIVEDLNLIGIAAIEFRLAPDREPEVQDVTPCPHRSANLTVDACVTSQFEQQLRAVCGLPLGSVRRLRPAAMAVLPEMVEPDLVSAYAFPEVKIHLCESRRGYLTATANSGTLAREVVRAARAALSRPEAQPAAT